VGGEAGVAEPAGPQTAGGAVMARVAAAFVPDSPFSDGLAPAWASEWGEDRFGAFAGFEVAGVAQIMRWIPPGSFRMGSPQDEPGRFDEEGPQHRVTLTQGFWLAETPCTQALWTAVMGDNPSRFRSAERPVERVSAYDLEQFFDNINAPRPGLNVVLPTEAQWERACRAGTTTSTYIGDMKSGILNNLVDLDAIAWFVGNSAMGNELAAGLEPVGPETQKLGGADGTRPVKSKTPNAWGLYDMLGNVWEWCADDRRRYRRSSVVDPVGREGPGEGQVIRGGSWHNDARYCRSACRLVAHPGMRSEDIGFRLAIV
jgi:formylglycine-generating enzyme required for sulfatase activity